MGNKNRKNYTQSNKRAIMKTPTKKTPQKPKKTAKTFSRKTNPVRIKGISASKIVIENRNTSF